MVDTSKLSSRAWTIKKRASHLTGTLFLFIHVRSSVFYVELLYTTSSTHKLSDVIMKNQEKLLIYLVREYLYTTIPTLTIKKNKRNRKVGIDFTITVT